MPSAIADGHIRCTHTQHLHTRIHLYSICCDLKHGNKAPSAKQHLLQRHTVDDSDAATFECAYLCGRIMTLHLSSRAQLLSMCKECATGNDRLLCMLLCWQCSLSAWRYSMRSAGHVDLMLSSSSTQHQLGSCCACMMSGL